MLLALLTSARVSAQQEATGTVEPENQTAAVTEPAPDNEAASLAKKLSNPVASLISVPLQWNQDFGLGPGGSGTKFTLNIQPVVPISITPSANLIVRTIVPVISQSDIRGNDQDDRLP